MAEMRQVYGPDAEVWLFGSRVDDNARGEDIDLYVETADATNQLDRYLEIRQRLFRLFGDRKIDLLVRSRQRDPLPIERIARKTGHKLSGVGQGPAGTPKQGREVGWALRSIAMPMMWKGFRGDRLK